MMIKDVIIAIYTISDTPEIFINGAVAPAPYGSSEGLFPSGVPAPDVSYPQTNAANNSFFPVSSQIVIRPTGWTPTLGQITTNQGFTNYYEPAYIY